MVVADATTLSCCCGRPCVLSILRAWIDEAQVVKRWSRLSTMVSLELRTTPRTLIEDTLSAPCITGRAGLEGLEDRLLWMISSFVLKVLSFRLLRAAQTEMLLNSASAVLMCLEPTRR